MYLRVSFTENVYIFHQAVIGVQLGYSWTLLHGHPVRYAREKELQLEFCSGSMGVRAAAGILRRCCGDQNRNLKTGFLRPAFIVSSLILVA